MTYRMKIKVVVFGYDTDGKQLSCARPDMDFDIAVSEPGQGYALARVEFARKYGSDLTVRTGNIADRNTLRLYVWKKADAPSVVPVRVKPFRKSIPIAVE